MKFSSKITPKILFSLVLFFSIVRFHPPIFPGIVSVYWYDFVLIIISFYWLFHVDEPIRLEVKEVCLTLFLLLPFLLIPALFVEYELLYTINLFKILLYAIYIILFLSLIRRSKITVPEYIKILDIAFLFVFVIGIIQLISPPFLGQLVHFLFGDDKLRSIWRGYPRIYSTYYNANWFAVYLLFMLTAWLNYYLLYAKKVSWLALRIFPLIILLFFSGSRSGIIVCGLVFILTMVSYKFSIIKLIKYTASLSVIGIALIGVLNYVVSSMGLDHFISRFDILFLILSGELTGDQPLLGRFASQTKAFELFMERPLFGYGDRPGNLIPHNSILTVLLSFGLFGFIALASFVSLVTIRIVLIKSKIRSIIYLKRCYLLFSVGLFVAMLAADFIYTSQVIFLWIISVAFILVFNYDSKYKHLNINDRNLH